VWTHCLCLVTAVLAASGSHGLTSATTRRIINNGTLLRGCCRGGQRDGRGHTWRAWARQRHGTAAHPWCFFVVRPGPGQQHTALAVANLTILHHVDELPHLIEVTDFCRTCPPSSFLCMERCAEINHRACVSAVRLSCDRMQCGWDRCWDSEYRGLADAMVSEGLAKAGYTWLMLDDCWVAGRNETTGELCVTPLPILFLVLFKCCSHAPVWVGLNKKMNFCRQHRACDPHRPDRARTTPPFPMKVS
jgi:hypothetical protein